MSFRPFARFHSALRALRDERGVALITAVVTIAAVSAVGTTVIYFSSSGFRSAARSATDQNAHALAEAGLDLARSTLYQASSYYDANAVPQTAVSLNGGTVTYAGALAGTIWTLTATGSLPNPTGPNTSPVTRTVSQQLQITTQLVSSPNNAVWNYLFADSQTTCTKLEDDALVAAPLYTRGDLCMEDGALITGSSVGVEKKATLEDGSSIGTSSSPIQQADIAGGCRYGSSGSYTSPCTSAQRVYASTITTTPAGYTKPPVDLTYWYANAKPGPGQNCTTGSFPGGFDNDSSMNRSLSGTVNLTPSSAYDCRVVVNSVELGRLTWTPGNPGTLVIAGTVFFDGSIKLTGTNALYQGKATVYASGTIKLEDDARLCGVSGCTSSWDPGANLLAFVAGSSTDSTGFKIEDGAAFQGAVYAVTDYKAEDGATVWGPVIARQIKIEDGAAQSAPIGQLLPGMPATYTQATVLVTVPGSYSG